MPQAALTLDRILGLFEAAIEDYHVLDRWDALCPPAFAAESLEQAWYAKAWIDTVQWHLEDEVRRTDRAADDLLAIKRRIDALNQDRTDAVEALDQRMAALLQPEPSAGVLRTESLAWALDRLCILQLKRYHLRAEVARSDADLDHLTSCGARLEAADAQHRDLMAACAALWQDLASGAVRYTPYRQFKLYNDPTTNPALYGGQG
ncbi:MAG: DUF4254 domain-containing protein [Schleiferiaceae bacterium]